MAGEARRRMRTLALTFFTLLLLALTAAGVFLLVDAYLAHPGAFNSDDLLCSSFCDDWLHGRDLRGWRLPGAPYLFPDLPLLAPCRLLAANMPIEFLAYSALLHLGLLGVLAWLGRTSGLRWRQALTASGCGVLLLACVHLIPDAAGRAHFLVHPGSHVGAILTGLFVLTLALRWIRSGASWTAAVLLLIAGGFGAFSDQLLIIQVFVPLALALLLGGALRIVSFKQVGGLLLLLAASLFLASAIKLGLQRWGLQFLELPLTKPRLRFPELFFLLRALYQSIEREKFLCALIALYSLLTWLVLLRAARGANAGSSDRTVVMTAALTFAFSPLCTIGSLWVLRQAYSAAIPRYTLNCWFFPCLLLPLFLCWLPGRTARWLRWGIQLGIVLLAVRTIGVLFPKVEREHFAQPYPPLARELDRLARQRGPLRGLSGFWLARATSWFSRENVVVNPLTLLGTPFFHASNPARFLLGADIRLPEYHFLLVRSSDPAAPSPGLLRLCFGEPAETIRVGADEIWLYDTLRSRPFDRFLRGRIAERMHERMPFAGPCDPIDLAHPKANAFPLDAAGVLVLEKNESLEIRFAQSTAGRLLDVSCGYEDRLQLDFYRGSERLGSVFVPVMVWPGEDYLRPGMQSRLLALPAALRDRPWDRVIARPRSPSGVARLGHLLVFAEDVPGVGEELPMSCPPRIRLEGERLLPVGFFAPFREEIDAAASGGRARLVETNYAGPMALTPELALPPGRYRLECALKVGDNSLDEEAVRLAVESHSPSALLGHRPLPGKAFPTTRDYVKQMVPFEIAEGMERIIIGIAAMGKTSIALDYVDVIAEPPDCTSEKNDR